MYLPHIYTSESAVSTLLRDSSPTAAFYWTVIQICINSWNKNKMLWPSIKNLYLTSGQHVILHDCHCTHHLVWTELHFVSLASILRNTLPKTTAWNTLRNPRAWSVARSSPSNSGLINILKHRLTSMIPLGRTSEDSSSSSGSAVDSASHWPPSNLHSVSVRYLSICSVAFVRPSGPMSPCNSNQLAQAVYVLPPFFSPLVQKCFLNEQRVETEGPISICMCIPNRT